MVKRVSCRFNVDNAFFGNLVMNYNELIDILLRPINGEPTCQ